MCYVCLVIQCLNLKRWVKLCVFVLEVLILGIAPKLLIGGVGSDGVLVSCGFLCVLL